MNMMMMSDSMLSKTRGKDPYPRLDDDDPRRKMTDQEILEKYIDLSDSDLSSAEKRSLYKVLIKYKDAFSLRDEIGLCPNMEIENSMMKHLSLSDHFL